MKRLALLITLGFVGSAGAQTNAPATRLELFALPKPSLRAGVVAAQRDPAVAAVSRAVEASPGALGLEPTTSAERWRPAARTLNEAGLKLRSVASTNSGLSLPQGTASLDLSVAGGAQDFSAEASDSTFEIQLLKRLEQGGYLTRPELPSDNLLVRVTDAIFQPEVVQLRKVAVSCSVVTAMKRRNPLCLLNPIFLSASW